MEKIKKTDRVPLIALSKDDIDKLPKEVWLKFDCYVRVEKSGTACVKDATLLATDKLKFEDAKYAIESLSESN